MLVIIFYFLGSGVLIARSMKAYTQKNCPLNLIIEYW